MQQAEALQLQKLVERLDGVISAKLNLDGDGELSEVHVLSEKGKNPKQLSRDIQSALSAATGGTVEHRIISIARVESPIKNDIRLMISGLDISLNKDGFSAAVTLTADDADYVGTCSDGPAASARNLTIAKASLDAIHKYLKKSVFCLCETQKIRIMNREAISVAITYRTHDGEKILTGTAMIGPDEYDAVIRATLDAVNRVLPQAGS